MLWELGECLKALSGMDAVALQPQGGAHAILSNVLIIRAYHESRGDAGRRTRKSAGSRASSSEDCRPGSAAIHGEVPGRGDDGLDEGVGSVPAPEERQ